MDEVYSALFNPPTGIESPVGIDHHHGTDNAHNGIDPIPLLLCSLPCLRLSLCQRTSPRGMLSGGTAVGIWMFHRKLVHPIILHPSWSCLPPFVNKSMLPPMLKYVEANISIQKKPLKATGKRKADGGAWRFERQGDLCKSEAI